MLNENITANNEGVIKELAKVGAHFGCSRARRHPSVFSRVFGFKNRSTIIDLTKTIEDLERAKDFLKTLSAEGKQVLFVGTKNEAREVIRRAAAQISMPFVDERWIGGTFTNFPQIRQRIDRMQDLKSKDQKGELSVYTKKERLLIGREIANLERYFLSLSDMAKLPAAVIVVDSEAEKIVINESIHSHIPVIALAGPDCDVRPIAYPIVANDSSRESIAYIINQLVEAYKKGKK